ncbi:serine/arginine repetitive matrix protein 1-like [Sorghum bicolor]|uniref:serine/arginine repetitive matrix protein 1-like n=1 Tax=Sorghum bicolor TaxID=4558 RepID=UPI000B42503D|nr:serine/arginine repetitive matrix protein 1-like [Sorghum bicolor]|eukprot:XP_021305573.1 serine/arginine repetitive matrix protein 1-like [Sorghum bicolor]
MDATPSAKRSRVESEPPFAVRLARSTGASRDRSSRSAAVRREDCSPGATRDRSRHPPRRPAAAPRPPSAAKIGRCSPSARPAAVRREPVPVHREAAVRREDRPPRDRRPSVQDRPPYTARPAAARRSPSTARTRETGRRAPSSSSVRAPSSTAPSSSAVRVRSCLREPCPEHQAPSCALKGYTARSKNAAIVGTVVALPPPTGSLGPKVFIPL